MTVPADSKQCMKTRLSNEDGDPRKNSDCGYKLAASLSYVSFSFPFPSVVLFCVFALSLSSSSASPRG